MAQEDRKERVDWFVWVQLAAIPLVLVALAFGWFLRSREPLSGQRADLATISDCAQLDAELAKSKASPLAALEKGVVDQQLLTSGAQRYVEIRERMQELGCPPPPEAGIHGRSLGDRSQ